jgi:hypothetical protein
MTNEQLVCHMEEKQLKLIQELKYMIVKILS